MPKKPTPLRDTDRGVAADLETLYVYPDGHMNLVFADGTNWPLADEFEAIELLSGKLLRPMLLRARRNARRAS